MSELGDRANKQRNKRFLIVCSRPELVQYAINDIVIRESPRLGDEFFFLIVESASTQEQQREAKIAQGGEDIPAMMILQSIMNTMLSGSRKPEVKFNVNLDVIVNALKQLGFEVKVVKHNLSRLKFENILLSVYRAIKEATDRGKDVVINISCCDNVTAIAAFTAAMLAMKKLKDRVRIMDIRSELEPMKAFSPVIPPSEIRLRETARKVVQLLHKTDNVPLSKIAQMLGVSKATASRAVSELEKHGIVSSHFQGRIKLVERGPLFELADLII